MDGFTVLPSLMAWSSHSSWWLLAIAVPGLWLAFRLYAWKNPAGRPAAGGPRRILLPLTAAAWLLLALFAVAPRLLSRPEIWHPPSVVLALDQSASYRLAGLRDSAIAAMNAARAHYQARGFRVEETGFPGAISALRRGLDTASPPHLQAVFVWTDGRFHDAEEDVVVWPAPVHPVMQASRIGEVQGESAAADFTTPGGATLAVTWRSLDASRGTARTRDANLELHAGGRLLWKTVLAHPPAARPGDAVASRLILPADVRARALAQEVEDDSWFLLLRPHESGANATGKNDTVPVIVRTRNRPLHIFSRPLASLEERGLLDALRASESRDVSVLPIRSWRVARRDVVWIPVDADRGRVATANARAAEAGAPVVIYGFTHKRAEGEEAALDLLGPDARLEWKPEGAEFLPAGALRLADLGLGGAALRAPDSALEPLAWAAGEGGRGLLFWRRRDDGVFGAILPPLWRTVFAPRGRDEATAARNLAGAWARGIGEWAAAHGGVRVMIPDPLPAGQSFTVRARVNLDGIGDGDEARGADGTGSAAGLELVYPDGSVSAMNGGPGSTAFLMPPLSAGRHEASLRAARSGGGMVVLWSGTLRVRDPLDIESARLGVDGEALRSLAARGGGKVMNTIDDDSDEEKFWPELPEGQLRESRARSLALTPPFATALVIAILLSSVWAVRKRFRFD